MIIIIKRTMIIIVSVQCFDQLIYFSVLNLLHAIYLYCCSSPGGSNNRFSVHIPLGPSSHHNPQHVPLQSSLSYIPPSSSPSPQTYYQHQQQPHPPPPPATIRVFLPEGQRTTVSNNYSICVFSIRVHVTHCRYLCYV